MNRILRLCALAAVLACAATTALAQPTTRDARFEAVTLDISADGEVKAAPDMATISLGVTELAPTAAEALQENADAMTKVVAALRAGGIEARDIQTANLSLAPQYDYAQNQPPKLTGYQASNQVAVIVRDLTKLGAAVDAVVSAGATNVGGVQFGLMSRVPAENAARLAAVKALEDKAALYAEASGYHIGRLVNLSEGGQPQQILQQRDMVGIRAVNAMATPVEAGDMTVQVTVTGEFELTR